jgi:hypothetical protein
VRDALLLAPRRLASQLAAERPRYFEFQRLAAVHRRVGELMTRIAEQIERAWYGGFRQSIHGRSS